MELQRGMRDKLDKYFDISYPFEVNVSVNGSGTYDFCCFGVDENGKLTDDRYMIFYNQLTSPDKEIIYENRGNNGKFLVNLSKLPAKINKLVFTVSIDGDSSMGNISSHVLNVCQNGVTQMTLNLSGADFMQEKAIISVEIYLKDVWRISAVARGFNGGLGDLLRSYGGQEIKTSAPKVTAPVPQPPEPEIIRQQTEPPKKINLQKGQKVNLVKGSNGLGEISINLNWKRPTGLFSRAIDLDLGCLFELKDGSKGCVQALGNSFGSLTDFPYIALDGDDRSGSSANGETMRVNGSMVSKIKRILVYTFIYEGTANWKGADGVVTVKCPGSPEITVHMDEYGSNQKMCAIAMFENVNDTLCVEKLVQFYNGHLNMDEAFNWGLKWVAGRK